MKTPCWWVWCNKSRSWVDIKLTSKLSSRWTLLNGCIQPRNRFVLKEKACIRFIMIFFMCLFYATTWFILQCFERLKTSIGCQKKKHTLFLPINIVFLWIESFYCDNAFLMPHSTINLKSLQAYMPNFKYWSLCISNSLVVMMCTITECLSWLLL